MKGYVSTPHQTTGENLPQFENLRVTSPVPEYLLAMKCLAVRIGGVIGESSDVADIIFLIRHLRLSSAESVFSILAAYYCDKVIPSRTQYLIQSLFDERKI